MAAPVSASDGHVYEKAAIQTWFSMGKTRSPMTNKRLRNTDLHPLYALRTEIREWQEAQRRRQAAAAAAGFAGPPPDGAAGPSSSSR